MRVFSLQQKQVRGGAETYHSILNLKMEQELEKNKIGNNSNIFR